MSRSARFALCTAVAAVAMCAVPADASFISTSPDPMLGGDLVSTGPAIDSPFGFVTFTVTNIKETSNTIVGGNNLIQYTASPILTFYEDPNETHILAVATFQGQFEIEIFGRTSPFETGEFTFQFLSSTASGLVEGLPVSVQLDPTQTSGGTTKITAGPGLGEFTIETTAIQYSQFSADDGPFVNTPPINLVGVAPVPEPASLAMLATALVGLGAAYRRHA